MSIRIAEGTQIFKFRLCFFYFNLSHPICIAKHDLRCVQFADSAGKLLPGLLFKQLQLHLLLSEFF
jgi:hypothetical protein